MAKAILYLCVVAGAVLAAATITLVTVNWSQKIWTPIASVVLGGTLAVLFTTLALLQAETIRLPTAATTLVFDNTTHTPVFIIPAAETPTLRRLGILKTMGLPRVAAADGKSRPISLELPTNNAEMFTYSGELLQYYVFKEIIDVQNGMITGTSVNNVLSVSVRTPPRVEETVQIQGDDLLRIAAASRFANSDDERASLTLRRLPLPDGTEIRLNTVPASPTFPFPLYQVILRKPNYFEMIISLRNVGGTGGLPPGVLQPGEDPAHLQTVLFEVTSQTEFQWWTAGNKKTPELKAWAKWLMETVQASLSTS